MKYYLLALLLAFTATLPAAAQTAQDSLTLIFDVSDGLDASPIRDARITVLDAADSSRIGVARYNIARVFYGTKFSHNDTLGYYCRVPRRPVYLIRLEAPEYEPAWQTAEVPARQYIKVPTRTWNVKTALFKQRIYELGEATVTASRILMVTKGDTVEFNAAALQMADGDMLSHLVEALPGIQIGEGGQITYNGQFVKNLLVNGREFFHGNPSVALQNLPAYTVKKIQIYHDASGRMPEPGLKKARPRETDPLVMDVRLKREYAESWLAHIQAAGGLETGHGGDWLYRARLFATRFTSRATFVAFGNFNNLSDQSEPTSNNDSSWGVYSDRPADQGVVTIQNGGMSLSYDDRVTQQENLLRFTANLQAQHRTADQSEKSAGENFLEGGNTYSRSRRDAHTHSTNLYWKSNVNYNIDNLKYLLEADFTGKYSHFSNGSLSQAAAFSADPQDAYLGASLDSLFSPLGSNRLTDFLINRQQQASLGRYDDVELSGNAGFTFHEPWWGKRFQVSFGGGWKHRSEENFLLDEVRYSTRHSDGTDGYRQDRYTRLPTSGFDYYAQLTFPSWAKIFGKTEIGVQSSYQFSQKHSEGERSLWRLDRLDSWDVTADSLGDWDQFEQLLRPVAGDLNTVIDVANTYRTTEDQKEHTINISPTFFLGQWGLNLYFSLHFRHSRIEDYRAFTPRQLSRNDVLFNPTATFYWQNFSLTYRFTPSTPSLLYLLDVRDDSDPLFISYGNANLRNSKTHSLNARYRKSYDRRQRSFYINASYNKMNDQVSIAQTYDRNTGRRTSMPLNVDGNWGTQLSAGYGQTLDPADKLYFNLGTNAGLTHNVGFLSDTEVLGEGRQAVDNLLWDGNLRLDYRITSRTRLSASADFSWRYTDSDRPDFTTLRTTDFSYGLLLTTQLPGRIDLETELQMNSRRGYLDASMNDDCLVWNATLSRSFGRQRNWIVTFSARDLLRQISNVRRTLDALGRTETHYNTMPAYVLLSVAYHFKPRAKADARSQNQ